MTAKGSTKSILEDIGDPAVIVRELESFSKAARLFSTKEAELTQLYPNQWVAFYRGRVRATGKTLQSLLDEVDRKKLPRDRVIIHFMEQSPRAMIL
ncbi:MAG: hypothetical protein HYY01_09540 [Chloroflexi bacterium]|nr:hypothetical protein [Chloroflexota bacterium]